MTEKKSERNPAAAASEYFAKQVREAKHQNDCEGCALHRCEKCEGLIGRCLLGQICSEGAVTRHEGKPVQG